MQEASVYPMGTINRFIRHISPQIACDGDMSYPESVYKGLIEVGTTGRFFERSFLVPPARRVVVHIGDAGDNHSGSILQ
ncbi:MAG: hypothetical protein R2861_17285 [Desulfobacterales bacterium]